MDIINIITTENNQVTDIDSFAIVCSELQSDVVEEAEKTFKEKVKDLSGEEIDRHSMEDYTEDGFYKSDGIAISIVWSSSKNE